MYAASIKMKNIKKGGDNLMLESSKMNNNSRKGFASMDPDKQRKIASKGGRAAHRNGTAHEFTPEEAREAGRKGGKVRSSDFL